MYTILKKQDARSVQGTKETLGQRWPDEASVQAQRQIRVPVKVEDAQGARNENQGQKQPKQTEQWNEDGDLLQKQRERIWDKIPRKIETL